MNDSFIKILRKFTEWEWYNKSEMVHLFIHLLLKANFVKGNFQGHEVERGQLIVGLKKLNKDTGISEQSLRTCLNRLKSTQEITIKSTNKFSLVTIVKYEEYQSFKIKSTGKSTGKLTNKQHSTNIQLTTIEEVKESKELKNVSLRENFIEVDRPVPLLPIIEKAMGLGNFFYIGLEMYKMPISKYILNELQIHTSAFMPQVQPITLEQVNKQMDLQYNGGNFTNHGHVIRAFNKVAKELKTPPNQYGKIEAPVKATISNRPNIDQ